VPLGTLFIAKEKGFFANARVDLNFVEDAGARILEGGRR
jgi:ABC-type nitrate/sulfonate/bicarbonate transport system substrate-binding protein